MAEVKIEQSDIDRLASKLDELGEVLSENERGILLAVFGLAATALSNAKSEAESGGIPIRGGIATFTNTRLNIKGSMPRLSEGFKGAFQPGRAGRFEFGGIGPAADISVGGATVTWTA